MNENTKIFIQKEFIFIHCVYSIIYYLCYVYVYTICSMYHVYIVYVYTICSVWVYNKINE